MSDSLASLRHQISSAEDIKSVVSTMKAIAASSIGQYETAVHSLDDYYHTVQLGLAACFHQSTKFSTTTNMYQAEIKATGVIVFGSDQGLVGQFNESMVAFAVKTLEKTPGKKTVWAVGERIQSRLDETDLLPVEGFVLPNSINAITPLIGQILIAMEAQREQGAFDQVYLFYNRPRSDSVYMPVAQRLLPLDKLWRRKLSNIKWPTKNLPELMNNRESTLRAMIREYLFVSLFRACAESLASENASRLAAMQRAEKNVDELQQDLNRAFYRLRQKSIDEELFDVISGFEALSE